MATETYVGQSRTLVSAAGAVKAKPGRLVKIIVTQAGSGDLTVHDHPSAASGDLLFQAPATAPEGTIYALDVPCLHGIYVTPGTGQTLVVVWS